MCVSHLGKILLIKLKSINLDTDMEITVLKHNKIHKYQEINETNDINPIAIKERIRK